MNRYFAKSVFAVLLMLSIGSPLVASTVNVSLDLFFHDSDGDHLPDTAADGTWQLYATADSEGLAALAINLNAVIVGDPDATFAAPDGTSGFHDTYAGGTKPFDNNTDGNPLTLEMLFPQVPVESPGPQDLLYDAGKLGGSTPNVDELGAFVDTSGNSMTDAVFLAHGSFGAGSFASGLTTGDIISQLGATIFTVEGTATDPPPLGTIQSPSTLTSQIRTNLATLTGDVNLDGTMSVDSGDFTKMSENWDGGNLNPTAIWQTGDLDGDKFTDASDFTILSAAWTGDPGPAGAGEAIAEYYPDSGQILVSFAGVNNWFIESLSGSLTGAAANLPGTGLATDNGNKIGESNIFLMPDQTDWDLGLVAATGLGESDLFLTSTAGLGEPAIIIPVNVIPEPSSLALAALGLCGALARRRRLDTWGDSNVC